MTISKFPSIEDMKNSKLTPDMLKKSMEYDMSFLDDLPKRPQEETVLFKVYSKMLRNCLKVCTR